MAEVYLACEAALENHPFAWRDFERLVSYAAKDRVCRHRLVQEPDQADLVIFVGSSLPNFKDVRSSELYRKYKQKSVLVFSGDHQIPVMPGVYTCLEKRWFSGLQKGVRSGFYLRVADNSSMDITEPIAEARYLFSFVGSSQNHPVRKSVCRLNDERGYIFDSAGEQMQADGMNGENHERGLRYRDTIAQSKFILCPAGRGIATWRLFEAMRAGRVPVIIADRWIPTEGPDWSSSAVFVAEKDVASIPDILRAREVDATLMGSMARQAWETFFSAERAFSTVVDLLIAAHDEAQTVGLLSKAACFLQYVEPFYLRHWVLPPIKQRLLKR